VLFSDQKIAAYINDNFEPAWESVRSVPKVTADFGDGRVITKTFRGNIATYVCNKNGAVVDVLPGLYSPAAYLKELRLLSRQAGGALAAGSGAPASSRHESTTSVWRSKALPPADAMESMLSGTNIHSSSDLSSDTDVNEHERRQMIHERLAETGTVAPAALKSWLYKEVLHCDLNDPYLGMHDFLFAGAQLEN
jgi:hypothetical protein